MPAYKDAERGTWYVAFYYTDWTGQKKKKKKRGFKKRSDALEFEREFLTKQSANCDISFKTLVELYFEDMSNRLRTTTLSHKKYVVESKITPIFGELPINTIKATHIRHWQNELLSTNYTQTYLKSIHSQLSAIFNYAVKYYDLKDNPCLKAGSIGKQNAESMQFWTLEEFNAFLEPISSKLEARVAFLLLFWTGMRSGELLAITLNDFNFDAKVMSISKSYAREKGQDIISPPKTPKGKRVVTLPEFLILEISGYIDTLYDLKPTDRLFPHTKHFLSHEMIRGCKHSKVKRIRVHDLRHSHASLLIDMDFSPILISERLGHEKVETTLQTYAHLYPNKHEEAAQKLNALVNTQ